MAYTISVHMGSTLSLGHNMRSEGVTAKDGHIDADRTPQNITLHEGWDNLRDAYTDIFGDAVKSYNEKQQRADRKVTDYYGQVCRSKKQHAAYEVIVQVGNERSHPSPQEVEAVAREYIDGWSGRNGNAILVRADLHMDEATPHIHAVYIPVAHYTRGQEWRVGLNRCLEQIVGNSKSRSDTAQIRWQAREREVLHEICRRHGLETVPTQSHSKEEQLQHLDTLAYKAQQIEREAAARVPDLKVEDIAEVKEYKTGLLKPPERVTALKKPEEAVQAIKGSLALKKALTEAQEALQAERRGRQADALQYEQQIDDLQKELRIYREDSSRLRILDAVELAEHDHGGNRGRLVRAISWDDTERDNLGLSKTEAVKALRLFDERQASAEKCKAYDSIMAAAKKVPQLRKAIKALDVALPGLDGPKQNRDRDDGPHL